MSFNLFFAGAEEPGWRRLLTDEGVKHIALSYANLQKRLPKTKEWRLADHVADDVEVFIDSGAFAANKDPGRRDHDGWVNYDAAYVEFVQANIERISLATEFDAVLLGADYINAMRRDFWDHIPTEKFLPVWHPNTGLSELDRLAERYDRVAVPGTGFAGLPNLGAHINHLEQKYGTLFHGSALTKPEVLTNVRFSSSSSTSWLSPTKYGDTIVWSGTRLIRYPRAYKEQSRQRHKMLFERQGFDPAKILADDQLELNRYTIWAWLQFESTVSRRRGSPARPERSKPSTSNYSASNGSEPNQVLADTAVDNTPPEPRKTPVTRPERVLLPIIGIETVVTAPASEEGGDERTQDLMRLSGAAVRSCDNCYVADLCPQFQPGHECAFSIPVTIKSKEQLTSVLTGMLEMETQRVLFARFNEELQGGFPDPNVSTELDRLFNMTKTLKEISTEGDFLQIIIKTHSNAGVMSRVFGSMAQSMRRSEQPELPEGGLDQAQTDALLSRIMQRQEAPIDAEVIEDN